MIFNSLSFIRIVSNISYFFDSKIKILPSSLYISIISLLLFFIFLRNSLISYLKFLASSLESLQFNLIKFNLSSCSYYYLIRIY
jgi:hypothetical protein